MTSTSVEPGESGVEVGVAPLRVVTAASLFDGHDAAINVMRRLIQSRGAEVIHLGHNRGVAEVVRAAIQEDADAVAISSYQGGHVEYFRYMVEMLRERGAGGIRVFGGGGGTITPTEIAELQALGVERIYHPNDGLELGLEGMIDDLVARASKQRRGVSPSVLEGPPTQIYDNDLAIAETLSALEDGVLVGDALDERLTAWETAGAATPVVGITGTGGAGKSTVTDEILARLLEWFPELSIAVVAVDPTRRRTGGALLGDRIRMNSLRSERHVHALLRHPPPERRHERDPRCRRVVPAGPGFEIVIVETAGIGQSDSEIVDLVDLPLYVMTPEYGAASQLEKIDMLDLAALVVLNKFDRRGGEDALRDVRKQWRRNRVAFTLSDDEVPVYPTIASRFGDPGITRVSTALVRMLASRTGAEEWQVPEGIEARRTRSWALIPAARIGYLAEIADARARARGPRRRAGRAAQTRHSSSTAPCARSGSGAAGRARAPCGRGRRPAGAGAPAQPLRRRPRRARGEPLALLRSWDAGVAAVTAERSTRTTSAAGSHRRELPRHAERQLRIPKVALPSFDELGRPAPLPAEGEPARARSRSPRASIPYRREEEDPTRMFAGEGRPERTNRRFHYVAARPAGDAAVDGVRLRHALRRGSRPSGRTSTARSATPASRSRRSTTRRSSTRASTSARRRPRSR